METVNDLSIHGGGAWNRVAGAVGQIMSTMPHNTPVPFRGEFPDRNIHFKTFLLLGFCILQRERFIGHRNTRRSTWLCPSLLDSSMILWIDALVSPLNLRLR